MKYGKDITNRICRELKSGMNRTDTCAIVGISYETFRAWMEDKLEFSAAVNTAEAKCREESIRLIRKAARHDWKAAGWWLERKHPDEFAQRHKVDLEKLPTGFDISIEAAPVPIPAGTNGHQNGNGHNGNGHADS